MTTVVTKGGRAVNSKFTNILRVLEDLVMYYVCL